MDVSEYTARHLQLGPYVVWARMVEGFAVYLVLLPDITPHSHHKGYHALSAALATKHLR